MNKIIRRKTRTVTIGGVRVGRLAPVTVQSMTKTRTADTGKTIRQIRELEAARCAIIRVAVLDKDDARAISTIRKNIHIPLEADIHFSPELAMEAISAGADGIRLNPGNIRGKDDIKMVVLAAKKRCCSIRVGSNSGSILPKNKRASEVSLTDVMVAETLKYCRFIDSLGFHNIMVSLKASDVLATVRAYRRFAEKSDYPLHLGVTAAGLPETSAVRSAIGIGSLLLEGIGDTIRVSVTGDPKEEVAIGYEILRTLGFARTGPEIISCPTCGRCQADIIGLTLKIKKTLENFENDVKIAIMGCPVNGPGEARDADIGIAAGKGFAVLFENGKITRQKMPISSVIPAIINYLKKDLRSPKRQS